MKVVVGLGNPGSRYSGNRHNIGFDVVRVFGAEVRIAPTKKGFLSLWGKGEIEGRSVIFLLPQTYMNRSGEAVREARDYYRAANEDLIVVHDDLDLVLGRVKLDFDAGAAGHRGIASLIEALGTKRFHRIRMGIGRPAAKEEVERFVLSRFEDQELGAVQEMTRQAQEMLRDWILKETQ